MNIGYYLNNYESSQLLKTQSMDSETEQPTVQSPSSDSRSKSYIHTKTSVKEHTVLVFWKYRN